MRKIRYAAAGIFGALACIATPAMAAKMVATYIGTVTGAADRYYIFDPKGGAALAGMNFTATIAYDTTGFTTDYADSTYAARRGMASWTFTLNGVSWRGTNILEESLGNGVALSDGSVVDRVQHVIWNADQRTTTLGLMVDSPALGIISTLDPAAPFSYTVRPGDTVGTSYLRIGDWWTGTAMNLAVSSIDVRAAVTPAVPEPSTWLLMLTGFGAVGAALRIRRRVAFA